ncbi:MAG: helix-turn-helix transcriptional regulator [Hyphomonadaceae bacterium]|nr:helix-turn-helix transcriptional regulator [Hyphomonadaceae bacterium]
MPNAYVPKRRAMDPCPVELAVRMISGKWKVRALYLLSQRRFHFAELQRALGEVRQQVLSTQLREMRRDGLIAWTCAQDAPRIAGYYEATAKGCALVEALRPLMAWGVGELSREGFTWRPPQV